LSRRSLFAGFILKPCQHAQDQVATGLYAVVDAIDREENLRPKPFGHARIGENGGEAAQRCVAVCVATVGIVVRAPLPVAAFVIKATAHGVTSGYFSSFMMFPVGWPTHTGFTNCQSCDGD
jgi:hypothetical protein